mgnify:CR=1 FL=1
MLELPPDEVNYYQLGKRNKWAIEEITKFKEIINNNINNFDNIINTIYEYNLPFNQITCLNENELHMIGLKNYFNSKNYSRNIKQLLKEHKEILKEKNLSLNSNNDNSIIQKVREIQNLTNLYSNSEITKDNITEDLKKNDIALLAIINNNIKKVKKFPLRDSQIYALLALLNKKINRGKIVQILTGEGKTVIINCLAIIMVLKGHKVDIVTSNPVLAKRDSEEAEELFSKFGITVGNNIPDERKIIKNIMDFENDECYTKDVVYGTTFEFQADILRDEYELLGTRKKRSFDIVIVDEIDSMLIDEYASKTRLAKSKPFLEKYSYFLQLLWSFYKAYNLTEYDIMDKEVCNELVKYLTNKIKDVINLKSSFKINLSEESKKFALDQVDNWVENLIKSLKMKVNNEYLIINNDIVPVDQDNTGVIQKSVTLSFGLHQFLQMKHNLPVTSLSITTNYLSNLGFFKRYNTNGINNIFGMTGTLGSQSERELLGNIYELDFDYIPPNSPHILKELTSKICFNEKNWYKNIIRIVKREINANRGILIICDSIECVDNIYNELKIHCQNIELIRIIGEDNEDKLFPNQMGLNQVIISTNISGRGTDIKLCPEILDNGGLHVMITFIPNNSRVEEQNSGRAGRKGEPGTWQLVINFQREIRKFYSNYEIKDKYKSYVTLVQELSIINNRRCFKSIYY